MDVKTSEYKGFPVLQIKIGENSQGEPNYFSFGLRKAQAIVKHIEAIKKFVEDSSKQ